MCRDECLSQSVSLFFFVTLHMIALTQRDDDIKKDHIKYTSDIHGGHFSSTFILSLHCEAVMIETAVL